MFFDRLSSIRNPFDAVVLAFCGLVVTSLCVAEDKPDSAVSVKHQVTGLFSVDRVRDLEKTIEKIPDLQLVKVEFETAEATLKYDAVKMFPNQSPEKVIEELDNRLKQVSRHTFGIKPLCKIPRDKLQLIEIQVLGLDCKACCLAAYEAVYKLDGVEQATASFKDGLVTAWIDAEKTNREKLEDALVKRNVTLKNPKVPSP